MGQEQTQDAGHSVSCADQGSTARGAPLVITATVACWVSTGYSQKELMGCLEKGDAIGAVNAATIYGKPGLKEFGKGYVRIGEADVTLRIIPRDEQTRLMVQALQDQLAEERIRWHERQQAILAEISKLQAIEYVEAA